MNNKKYTILSIKKEKISINFDKIIILWQV